MPESSRLPTSVFTLVAVLVITLGAAWWVSAEPAAGQSPSSISESPTSSVVRLDLGTGRILTYWRGRPASSEQEAFENMVAEMKRPCRAARRTPYPGIGSGQANRNGLSASTGSRVARPSRCTPR
jgi:hypothetical protein